MKKILFIMHSMPTGGAERVLVDIMNHIDYKSYIVHLLLRDYDGGLLDCVPPTVKIYSLNGKVIINFFTRIRNRFLNLTGLKEIIDKKKTNELIQGQYDCIISFCQGPAHKLHQYLLKNSSNNVSWVHSDLKKGNWGITSFKNNLQNQEDAYNNMDQVIFVSEGAKMSFNEIFRINNKVSQSVVYNIVDRSKIVRLAASKKITKPVNKFVFVNVGRLVEAKNQDLLLKASQKLKEKLQDFEVWILGEGPLRQHLEEQIKEYGLKDHVRLLGNKSNPYPYVQSADAFVSSSRQEGFPMVLCEAISLSKPIISTDIVGPREVLDNGKYGVMVKETPEALSDAMYDMAVDNTFKERYEHLSSIRGRDFSTEDFMKSFYSIVNNDHKL